MKDEIYKNAKDFNRKALNNYVNKEIQYFLINSAISAELVGKAFLAGIHPSTIVDNKDFDSLLHVCGAGRHSRKPLGKIRTIGAYEVFRRCSQIVPKLRNYKRELELLADLRNGLVHLGKYDIAIANQVFIPYLKYIKTILEEMKASFDDYFGEFTKLANTNIQDSVKEKDRKVQRLIAKAKIDFKNRFEGLDPKVKENIIKAIIASYVLYGYDEELITCPVCDNLSVVSGYHELVDWDVDYDKDRIPIPHPIVELYADSFKCNVCGLKLDDFEELEATGIETTITLENVDPEDFYVPDDDYEDYYRDI